LLRDILTSIYALKMLHPVQMSRLPPWQCHCLEDRIVSSLQVISYHKRIQDFFRGGLKNPDVYCLHSNLVTPLHITIVFQKWRNLFTKYLPISGKLSITSYLKQYAVDYRSHLTIEGNLQVEIRYIISKTSTTFPTQKKRLG